MKKLYNIGVRHGKRGYVGYFGEAGRLHSTKKIRGTSLEAKNDAIREIASIVRSH